MRYMRNIKVPLHRVEHQTLLEGIPCRPKAPSVNSKYLSAMYVHSRICSCYAWRLGAKCQRLITNAEAMPVPMTNIMHT